MDGIHDMGGMHGFGPVEVSAIEPLPDGWEGWENRLQAVALLSGTITRPGIEAIEPATYLESTYHERWIIAAENRAVDKGKVDPDALARWRDVFATDAEAEPPRTEDPDRVARLQAMLDRSFTLPRAEGPRFAAGDRVAVKRMRPERHHRCPRYLRGAVGEVDRVPGQEPLPGTPFSAGLTEPVYTVRFHSVDLWGDRTDEGEPPYDLFIDLWESYLEDTDE